MQVIKTFHIHDLFHEAINLCPDITQGTFSFLSKNKSSVIKGRNLLILTTNAHWQYMIYIDHLYQARLMMKKLNPVSGIPPFNFLFHPTVEGIFTGIENHLCKLSLGSVTAAESRVRKECWFLWKIYEKLSQFVKNCSMESQNLRNEHFVLVLECKWDLIFMLDCEKKKLVSTIELANLDHCG